MRAKQGHRFEVLRIAAGDAIRAVALQAHRIREGQLIETAFDDVGSQLEADARAEAMYVALRDATSRFAGDASE
jgi:hypothetical protein